MKVRIKSMIKGTLPFNINSELPFPELIDKLARSRGNSYDNEDQSEYALYKIQNTKSEILNKY